MFLNCQWDGPDPRPGDYLAGRRGGPLKIRTVLPRPGHLERLIIEVQKPKAGERLPLDAVLHPSTRYAPHDPAGPARVRQLARQGETAVSPARWADPADDQPSARAKQRTVRGWRVCCPLRQSADRKGSLVSEKHIAAADQLRLLYDLARMGPLNARDGGQPKVAFGPRAGPPSGAEVQTQAAAEIEAAFCRFTADQQRMLHVIVLQSKSISAWCVQEAERLGQPKPLEPRLEMGRLLAVLDILVNHWRDRIDAALFGGVVL